MMNNDNSITNETILYGFISEEAHSNRFCAIINKLFKANGVNAMAIPMNIRPDDLMYTISQMRHSKLSGAVIGSDYQESVYELLDEKSDDVNESGLCDFIQIVNSRLVGDFVINKALNQYAENSDFEDEIALRSHCQYIYELTLGEK